MMNREKQMVRAMGAALSEVERVAPGLSLGQLTMFLHIARQEGVRMTDLSDLCGRSDTAVSRGVRAMAVADDPGTLAPAYGLVELLRGVDGRSRHLALTPTGVELARRLTAVLCANAGANLSGYREEASLEG